MKTPIGYRLRRSRLSARRGGTALLSLAVLVVVLTVFDIPARSYGGPTGIVAALLAVAFTAAAVWPLPVLSVTSQDLRIRERLVTAAPRFGGTTGRLRKIHWPDVAEILLAVHRGGVTMIVGYRIPYVGLRAVVADLPVSDEREVTEAISRVAPGTVIRSGGLPEILVHTRRSYVIERRPPRTRVLANVLGVLGAGITAALLVAFAHAELVALQAVIWVSAVRVWLSYSPVFVAPDRILVRSWGVSRTVPWSNIESVRLTATRGAGELTVRVGGSPGGRLVSQRIPRRTDLAEVDAIIRAYAPPHALRHGLPAE